MARKATPEPVSSKRLFDWLEADRSRRPNLRKAGYSQGRISNFKTRGIPRAEVPAIAALMGLTFEQYVGETGAQTTLRQPVAQYSGLSAAALEVARVFDQLSKECQEHVRQQVALLRRTDVDSSGRRRAVQHDVEIKGGAFRDRTKKRKKGVR